MKKNAIWAIIGLMGAALLGIILLQAYWINKAIQVNKDQFNKNAKSALSQVAQRLEEWEEKELATSTSTIESGGLGSLSDQLGTEKGILGTRSLQVTSFNINADTKSSVYQHYRSSQERKSRFLQERINPEYLEESLSKELKNHGIEIDYDYEIYSNLKNQAVIRNGSYIIVEEKTSQVTEMPEEKNELDQTKYSVSLFTNEIKSPGELIVYFPNKSSVVWSSVWPTLIAAFIFTAIVLFCFSYTIKVIFAQKKLSEMKTDFVNNMTHEFKTPIATISLAADSIVSPMIVNQEEKVKRFASIIKQENKRMLAQVEKVLQMALLDKQDFKLKLSMVDLHEIIEQAVVHSHLQAEKAGGEVIADLQASSYKIEGDATHISNIIHNLLDNANKYSLENPKISVHTRNVPSGVEVIVKDNGIGLSKEARKHIFDKFYRVHTGNLHDVKGFGLGLSYVKAMMTAHKGQVDVKSELGKGSSFILTFPSQINQTA